jgi:hypothetical protein
MDKSVSCRLAALTSTGIAEIKLNDASMGVVANDSYVPMADLDQSA